MVSYDRQGVLVWPDAKKREWAWEQANRGATVYRAQPAPAKTKKQHGCSWYLAVGVLALFVLALVIAVGAFMWPFLLALIVLGGLVATIATVVKK